MPNNQTKEAVPLDPRNDSAAERGLPPGDGRLFLPGTVFPVGDVAREGGRAFFDKVFFVSENIMLSHIREITGLDAMALQNWVKRKWVPNPDKKYYGREHLARFLLINALRDTLQIARVMYLLRYLNGTEPGDAVVKESELYHYLCQCAGRLNSRTEPAGRAELARMDAVIAEATADYVPPTADAARRLRETLRIMVKAWYAGQLKEAADRELDAIGAPADPKLGRVLNGGR